jgi:hypothetical protein
MSKLYLEIDGNFNALSSTFHNMLDVENASNILETAIGVNYFILKF